MPALLDAGHRVRCMARDPSRLALHPWRGDVEVVQADALDRRSLETALDGCDAAFYLIHSMDGEAAFSDRDRTAAANFRDAAASAGVSRIVYLGGLGSPDDPSLSPHLRSRHEVGEVLAAGPTPVIELRAAVIIGSGSVSFEMLRHLTEVLPVMVTPKWVRTRCQPIAVNDVISTLVASLTVPPESRTIELGGPDVLTYEEMMQQYAEVAGLPRRRIVPVPVLSPGLSSRWVGLVTPLPTGIAGPLIESLRNEVTVHDPVPARELGLEDPISYRQAVENALANTERLDIASRWSDALNTPESTAPTDPDWSGAAVLEDRRSLTTAASADALYVAVAQIGGDHGYYGMNWAWRLRGFLDQMIGGVGLRRGRRHPTDLRPGEALDFWRVAAVEPGRRIALRAEMKVPGIALLDWTIEDLGDRRRIEQVARFLPKGLWGRLYWLILVPFHGPVFRTMLTRIVAEAGRLDLPETASDAV